LCTSRRIGCAAIPCSTPSAFLCRFGASFKCGAALRARCAGRLLVCGDVA
jgi:hypothetical protein